ncbi:hypothetical protein EDD99_7143 [Streptomyces sp. 846.5]|nr:hypothetical protein [Streptomyces sp. 846.5]TDT95318.1 hypothetical protein EDD99_7143 [Streptomyces sp. 846.5]
MQNPIDPAQADGITAVAPESLVLSAHTVSILARHVAGRLGNDQAARAFRATLEDAAALAEAWVSAQLDALATPPHASARATTPPLVAASAQPGATPAVPPATGAQLLTATAAVLAATTQLSEGATARDISQHVAAQHQLDVSPGTVRAILSRHNREQAQQAAQQPATLPFGFGQTGGTRP